MRIKVENGTLRNLASSLLHFFLSLDIFESEFIPAALSKYMEGNYLYCIVCFK